MKINLLPEKSNWRKKLREGFDTERLTFRAFADDDFKAVFELSNEIELFTYIADINNSDDFERWLKSVYQKRNYLFFTIKGNKNCEYKGRLIGVLMLNKKESDFVEVGGWIGTEFQNKGYGKETTSGLVRNIKQKRPDIWLCAKTREDNFSALRVLDIEGIERTVNRCHEDNNSD